MRGVTHATADHEGVALIRESVEILPASVVARLAPVCPIAYLADGEGPAHDSMRHVTSGMSSGDQDDGADVHLQALEPDEVVRRPGRAQPGQSCFAPCREPRQRVPGSQCQGQRTKGQSVEQPGHHLQLLVEMLERSCMSRLNGKLS